ncbi:MAG: HTH domain-containing protein [Saccharofermentanales bacterium]
MEHTHGQQEIYGKRNGSQLHTSPYVLDVSPNLVHFSAEFKKFFCKRSKQSLQTEPISIGVNMAHRADAKMGDDILII